MKKVLLFLLVMGLVAFFAPNAEAQCAMCRASVESNVSEGQVGIGAGLNKGILFLMLAPYALIAAVGYAWYKNSKKYTEERRKVASVLSRVVDK